MGYEIFSQKAARAPTSPVVSIHGATGRMTLNAATTQLFKKEAVELVLLLWDQENLRIALRPITKKDTRAYKVSYGKVNNGASFSARAFLEHVHWKKGHKFTGPATWNEQQGILEIPIKLECIAEDKQLKLVPDAKRQAK